VKTFDNVRMGLEFLKAVFHTFTWFKNTEYLLQVCFTGLTL